MSLLDDLRQAQEDTTIGKTCKLCAYLRATEDDETREALIACAGGTIGERRFHAIMKAHQTGIGRDVIKRHRDEEHTP